MTTTKHDRGTPPGALLLLVRGDGAVLLQHRDDIPTIDDPGRWGIPGGAIEPGETAWQAAVREIREETGYRIASEALNLIVVRADDRNGVPVRRHYFWAAYDGEQPVLCLEGQEMRWMFGGETAGLTFCPGHREALAVFFATGNGPHRQR
jgi:8-oxo-dGTP pyrophosphatase MutT (NUDIX family)